MANSRWMWNINRLTASLGATVVVASAASPTPSPSLQSLLVAPAGAFAESQPGPTDGPMSASAYAGTDSLILAELKRDGYVQGYVRSWGDQSKSSTHVIVEEVIAFGGHRDAGRWLATYRDTATSQYLVHPNSADGVDSYFGGHYAEPSRPLYYDLGVFVKGNDFFSVTAISRTDDLGDLATVQAKRQFDGAPAYSISPNQWPENASSSALSFSAVLMPVAIGGSVVLVVLILVALVVVVVLTRRRPAPAAMVAPVMNEGPQMSEDGRFWWDGQSWRDATREVPPDALRSADGFYWWDSRTWRQVPPSS